MLRTQKRSNKKSNINPWLIGVASVIAIICVFLTVSIIFTLSKTNKQLVSLTFIPLTLGIIFEQKKLCRSWKEIGLKLLGAYCFSLLVGFLPGKNESNYSFENHIESFPFLFVFIFLLISWGIEISGKNDFLTSKISEGILLVQSLSIIYLLIDLDFLKDSSWFTIFISILGGVFCLFSLFHAFSSSKHSLTSKLFLSIWSSIIMAVFGIYYCIRVFKFDFSSDYSINDNLISFIQYFLLGVSSIYIFQNIWMLMRFLPSKNESSKEYKIELEKLKSQHRNRFSDYQINIFSSIFCLIFVGGIYCLNHIYKWIPSYTMIWLVFTFFPIIIYYFEKLTPKDKS